MKNLLKSELEYFKNKIRANPHYLNTEFVISEYAKYCQEIYPNPFNVDLVKFILRAVEKGKPLSVIRIGDGEINLMTYTYYKETPYLNKKVVMESLARRQHTFLANDLWLIILQDLMIGALVEADVVGVPGVWRKKVVLEVEKFEGNLEKRVRGQSGQWRGIDFLLNKAKKSLFNDKVIASAHLYFSIVKYLPKLLSSVNTVFLITNNDLTVCKLKDIYKDNRFIHINIKETIKPVTCREPKFLHTLYSKLPSSMHGSITLVGAGIWSQIYCAWVKQKGGVAIDIGSGFDLMSGNLIRQVQRKMDAETIKAFVL